MQHLKSEAPPGKGGTPENYSGFAAAEWDNAEDNRGTLHGQQPRPIDEIAADILIAGAEQRTERLLQRLPRLHGAALIDAKAQIKTLTQLVDDLEHGRPIDLPGGRAAA